MSTVAEQVIGLLAGDGVSKISERLGVDEGKAGSALATAVPLLLSALANNASKPEGAEALHEALAKDHDGSILEDVGSLLGNPKLADGAAILGHVLGDKKPAVTKGLAKGTGMNSKQIGQLLAIAAPLIMGVLGKQQKKEGLDASDLASWLAGQQRAPQQANTDLLSMLNTMLDKDKSGSAVNEIVGMVSKMFGKK